MLRPLLLSLFLSLICMPAYGLTIFIEMTPDIAGEDSVSLKVLDAQTTRFTIRVSTEDDPKEVDPRRPFVRRGSLEVSSERGLILSCSIQPSERGDDLIYSFDLENEYAKNARFTVAEHFDDGQVGGGTVFSYRLIEFIDSEYRIKEMFQVTLPQLPEGN